MRFSTKTGIICAFINIIDCGDFNVNEFISKVCDKLKQIYAAYVLKDPAALIARDYLKQNRQMDFRHRFVFEPNPVIFDCGGHNGDWTSRMSRMYKDLSPNIYVFEIVKSFVSHLQSRFKNDANIHIFDFGLGSGNKVIEFSVSDIATSVYSNSPLAARESGTIRDVVEFIEERSLGRIDLLKMNIEGGEYELLERLISGGAIGRCKNIQIQFHNYGEWSVLKRDFLKKELRKTHVCIYDFEWTFEGWQLIENPLVELRA